MQPKTITMFGALTTFLHNINTCETLRSHDTSIKNMKR